MERAVGLHLIEEVGTGSLGQAIGHGIESKDMVWWQKLLVGTFILAVYGFVALVLSEVLGVSRVVGACVVFAFYLGRIWERVNDRRGTPLQRGRPMP